MRYTGNMVGRNWQNTEKKKSNQKFHVAMRYHVSGFKFIFLKILDTFQAFASLF